RDAHHPCGGTRMPCIVAVIVALVVALVMLPLSAHAASLVETGSFFAGDPATASGAHAAVCGVDRNLAPIVVTGARPGEPPVVTLQLISGVRRTVSTLASWYAFDAGFLGGVNVSCTVVGYDWQYGNPIVLIGASAGPGGGPHVRVWWFTE